MGNVKRILDICGIFIISIFSIVLAVFLKDLSQEKKKKKIIDGNKELLKKSKEKERKINEKINVSIDDYNDLANGKAFCKRKNKQRKTKTKD